MCWDIFPERNRRELRFPILKRILLHSKIELHDQRITTCNKKVTLATKKILCFTHSVDYCASAHKIQGDSGHGSRKSRSIRKSHRGRAFSQISYDRGRG